MAHIRIQLANVLQKAPGERENDELIMLETWTRKKSKLFQTLSKGKNIHIFIIAINVN